MMRYSVPSTIAKMAVGTSCHYVMVYLDPRGVAETNHKDDEVWHGPGPGLLLMIETLHDLTSTILPEFLGFLYTLYMMSCRISIINRTC